MVNDYSRIGIPVDSPEALFELARQLDVSPMRVPGGTVLRWAPGSGEELWIEVDDAGVFVGAVPHFAGESAVSVRLESRVRIPGQMSIDAAFRAGGPRSPDEEAFRFVFECPDSHSYVSLRVPGLATVQLAAFAHELASYPTEEIYYATAPGLGAGSSIGLASRAFLPFGTISDPPGSMAMIAGLVVRSAMRTNSVTAMPFIWVLVENHVGRFDVVADASQLEAVPPAGSILAGTFCLSGRLKSYQRARCAWVERVLSRSRRT